MYEIFLVISYLHILLKIVEFIIEAKIVTKLNLLSQEKLYQFQASKM